MQLGVSEKAIACEVCHLGDAAARAGFLVGHDLQPLIGRPQDATLHGNPAFEVRQGLVQRARCIHLPVDPVDVSTRVPEDLENLVAKANGLDPGLPCRVHGLVEAPACKLRFDHSLRGRLRILDVEIEQAQIEIARFCRRTEDRPTRRVEGIKEESEFERVTLSLTLTIDGGVLLAKGTAGIAIVAEPAEKLVEHPLVAFWRRIDASRSIHRGKHRPKHPRHHLAVSLCFEAEAVDHDIEHSQRERQTVVVPELGIADRVASPHPIERQRVQQNPKATREVDRPRIPD